MEERTWKYLFLRAKEELCMLLSSRLGYCSVAWLCPPELFLTIAPFRSVPFTHATHWTWDYTLEDSKGCKARYAGCNPSSVVSETGEPGV